ncbi:transcriptional antiterminator, BglG family [Atopostipes suicloacalis DSM 15692]|uniref:Transcriptional antiterminator, BglG family n=1 Tax=Atopostipes suicloacalis DSM 15692 TaxID=1121025 RepID=A0A1M4ZR37_9LACT|nr:PRD domain-containing protein [Atopostipes suicloacalis]SHF20395.1 transcriptional antiterminator, BglG family [Atopostipes suicloacalis DSM 15692]
MKIKQIFNNNVVLTTNDVANEFVVMGRGIGFQKAKGDPIDPALIEKKFILSENVSKSIFPDIYHQLSDDEIDVVIEIIDLAEAKLGIEFQSNIYIALADHIHYALDRTQQLIPLTNPLNYEVKKYYPEEYKVGKMALKIIENRLGISLYKDEASSIALHFVTGQKEDKVHIIV